MQWRKKKNIRRYQKKKKYEALLVEMGECAKLEGGTVPRRPVTVI